MNVRKKGFTLIELMIVLAIVAILIVLALPSFQDTIRKSRRSDAMNAILDIHLSQERWRVNHTTYGTLAELEITNASPDGHYSLTITIPVETAATTYTIVAVAEGDQAYDSCGSFTLAVVAGVITKTADGNDALCWKK